VDKSEILGALFVDLSKAFDTLSRAILRSHGVKGIALKWFESDLFNRKQFCELDGVKSNTEDIVSGVPQGSIQGPIMFLLHFNDFEENLQHSRVIQIADDTVLYCSSKSIEKIEQKLNHDLQCISEYFFQNELIMNVSKGKTESMVFGPQKRLSMTSKSLNLLFNGTKITSTTQYKYLGTLLDQSLSLSGHFKNIYRATSNKLYLLNLLKPSLTRDAVSSIYTAIIQPGILFNSPALLKMTNTQLSKLESLDNRARVITSRRVPKIRNEIEKRSCLLVKKCLVGKTCETFLDYFVMNKHQRFTRNNGHMVVQPPVKLEFARAGFYSIGPCLFNSLPIEIRKCQTYYDFKLLCKNHFS
jgi:hypothetical protein